MSAQSRSSVALGFQRDELAQAITDMNQRVTSAQPVLTDDKVKRAAVLLREQLHDGPIGLRKDDAPMLTGEVAVTDEDIRPVRLFVPNDLQISSFPTGP